MFCSVSFAVNDHSSPTVTLCELQAFQFFPFVCVGHVTWDEYRVKFLASKGFNEKEVAEKIKRNEDLKVDEESE